MAPTAGVRRGNTTFNQGCVSSDAPGRCARDVRNVCTAKRTSSRPWTCVPYPDRTSQRPHRPWTPSSFNPLPQNQTEYHRRNPHRRLAPIRTWDQASTPIRRTQRMPWRRRFRILSALVLNAVARRPCGRISVNIRRSFFPNAKNFTSLTIDTTIGNKAWIGIGAFLIPLRRALVGARCHRVISSFRKPARGCIKRSRTPSCW